MHRLIVLSFVFVDMHPSFAYSVLFVAIFMEGELALLAMGVLVHLGILSFFPAMTVAVIAAIAKTVTGYQIGNLLGTRFPHNPLLKFLKRKIFYFLPRFQEKIFWSIFTSKFMYGINNLTLIFAGYIKADYKKYCLAELTSSVILFGGMFSLGYFFSQRALGLTHNMYLFMLLFLLLVIGIIVMQKLLVLLFEVIEEWEILKLTPEKE